MPLIKEIDHGDWVERIYSNGMVAREGNIPEHLQHEFYANYNPGAARIVHRGSPEALIELAQKLRPQEE